MRKKKILTISIAAYNVEDCIERCLRSLVIDDKHMAKMEVLIENDGSTDGTAKIAEKFVKKYPDTFKLINKKNGGYGSTVNNSIKLATGKYLKLLDGDDEYLSESLPDFIDVLEDTDADIISSPCIRVFSTEAKDSIIENPFPGLEPGERNLDVLIGKDCNKGCFKMHTSACKTEILRNNRITLPEGILYTDNIIAYVPLLYAKTIYVFDEPIYVYNIGREGQSISIEKRISRSDDRIAVSKEILEYASKGSSPVFNAYAGLVCAGAIADHLLLDKISVRNRRKIINFDEYVKNNYKTIWVKMEEYKTLKVLHRTNFMWIAYILLHFERRIKLGRKCR